MIKAEELRIGNWIASGTEFKHTSVIGKVRGIGNEDCEFEQIEVECSESFEWFFKDDYCGIPLTEDILIKAGFEYVQEGHAYFDKNHCIYQQISGLVIELDCDETKRFPIDNLHHLQNLIYFTTGTELNIKL